MCIGTFSNTNVFINGHRIMPSCCNSWGFDGIGSCGTFGGFPMGGFSMGGFTPGCFGFGYSSPCCNSFEFGAGAGLGLAAGMVLIPAMPKIIGGIGKGIKNLWQKVFPPKENKSEKA